MAEFNYRSQSDKKNFEQEKDKLEREITEFYSKEID